VGNLRNSTSRSLSSSLFCFVLFELHTILASFYNYCYFHLVKKIKAIKNKGAYRFSNLLVFSFHGFACLSYILYHEFFSGLFNITFSGRQVAQISNLVAFSMNGFPSGCALQFLSLVPRYLVRGWTTPCLLFYVLPHIMLRKVSDEAIIVT